MPASAQRHDLRLKLKGLGNANPITYQVPRTTGIVLPPAQPRIDPRRDALAAKIALQLGGRPAQDNSPKERPFKPPSGMRFPLGSLFDVPTLIVSLAATGLLVGLAFATMILSGAVDTPGAEPAPTPEKSVAVLSASAANARMPIAAQPSAPPVRTVRTVALPPETQSTPEEVDASKPEARGDGDIGLFGDVSEVYRADGRSGVTFGAIYDTPESGSPVTRIPDGATAARTEEEPAAAEAEQPPAREESAETKWIELPVSLNLRRGPSRSSGVIGVVEKGTRLQEIERQRGWVKVIDPETQETGWLYPDSRPKARRAAKQPAQKADQSKPASAGPIATLGDWLGKPAQQ